MSSSGVAGTTAADVWAAATRTLTAITGQPRTDLAGSDVALWSATARTLTALTGQPRTDVVGSDAALWAHATRLLREPIHQSQYAASQSNGFALAAAAGADTFGSWVQLSANVGAARTLLGLWFVTDTVYAQQIEIEIGEGAAAAEAAITSYVHITPQSRGAAVYAALNIPLTSSARLSARAKASQAGVVTLYVSPAIV